MLPLALFQWCESTVVGGAIKNSSWAFAVIESIHLLGLALIGGILLLVNLRLLGLGLRRYPLVALALDVQPWFAFSLVVMLLSGFALFLSEATKCYYSQPFWVKMASLATATLFTVTVQRNVVMNATSDSRPLRRTLVAIISLILWFSVGAAGRWIGFSG
jgi:hypothetical protein